MSLRPYDGFVVGVTADRRWEEQAELLSRRGASVVHGPTITTLYLASDDNLRRATMALIEQPPDYLVATTGIGMRAWLETAATWGVADDLTETLGQALVVARGPKAVAAVQIGGLRVWRQSPTEQMEALVDILLDEQLEGRRVAVQEYGMATPDLDDALGRAGAHVVSVPVYRWRLPTDRGPARRLVKAACSGEVDAITFTSAPAVHNLFALAGTPEESDRLRAALNGPVAAACVGPVCAEGARQEGIEDPLTPSRGRLGLLVRTLGDHLVERRRTYKLAGQDLVVQGGAIEIDGIVDSLTAQERAILDLLTRKPGAVIRREALLARIWGSPDADAHLLEVAISRLRRRLGPAGTALHAISGRGYRLDPDEQ
ncbi:MAG TPA: uroporphyrinogen-III synthase [Acidimicrobiales bacterium]|jgi:uroporphyrinogen-III synthase|nr:uroporphyrinogen-III synthase [Acidimicrobiales bacterium]